MKCDDYISGNTIIKGADSNGSVIHKEGLVLMFKDEEGFVFKAFGDGKHTEKEIFNAFSPSRRAME